MSRNRRDGRQYEELTTPYQRIARRLSIDEALASAAERNDLVPPRLEDKVSGELGKRFLEALRRRIERARYDPKPAYFVAVPKNGYTTRLAAILTFSDRVIYEAMVALLRPGIEAFLLSEDVVFWPRGERAPKRWEEFERSAIKDAFNYVVRGDVTGFYESVEHERLIDAVVEATGDRDVADALSHFLERVMGSRRGLPQGLVPSDALATLYLGKLDLGLVRRGLEYTRHGDDLRIATKTFDEGRRAIQYMERELRELGLMLNSEKTRVLRKRTYEEGIDAFERGLASARKRTIDVVVKRLAEDTDELANVMRELDMEQLEWDFFYHGSVDLGDVIKKLRPKIKVRQVQVAEMLFADAMKEMETRDEKFNRESFHQQLVAALVRLSAGRSPVPLEHIHTLAKAFPDKTEALCSYLSALTSTKPQKVGRVVENAMKSCVTEWELAWMTRVLGRVHRRVSEEVLNTFAEVVATPHDRWLAAVEAVKVLGVRCELERQTVVRMWNAAPEVFRVDLVVGAAHMAGKASWAKGFVLSAIRDPIHEVAVRVGVGGTAYRRLKEREKAR